MIIIIQFIYYNNIGMYEIEYNCIKNLYKRLINNYNC